MKNKSIKLGYSVSLPIKYNKEMPEYSIENINLIKSWTNKFDCIQIMFSKKNLNSNEIKEIKSIIKNYKNIFVHASYQINIGAELLVSQIELYNINIDLLINEIIWSNKIGAKGIILHMGKNVKKKYDPNHVYNNMIKFVIELFAKLKKKNNKIPILFETPAGQGGEMCWNLKDFLDFIGSFSNLYFYKQIGICIDTCHIFQAGYDINNIKEIKLIHKIFKPYENKINLIHLNDSKYDIGNHIDRHEQIGKGKIQIDKLCKFIFPYIKLKIPMILETIGPYENQIKLIST